MPNLKIVEFKSTEKAYNNNSDVIRLLEEALSHAKANNTQSMALVMLDASGDILDCWHSSGRPYVMVGAIESLRQGFIIAYTGEN
ncbi:hypothetical protein ACQX6W_20160 [Salmonella enterica]|uniref:Uncharacterized protein n=2 Tax=Salmonella enterica TaxID=28901 RepID=A0A6Y1QTZ8_SALDZ|nr:hypothetical protein [Salmonella enterica subsp. enterica serovar Berkeley]EBW7177899.1 hypothetical protein [Salmonella enterica subsp. enterica serovar Weltevreden]EBX9479749.1 hypothetical protein [Salmonella enterica subsp. enterica serovar Abony]ECI4645906.1 hypothetical protein [Salmonella enterica subsp. salamae]ECJ5923803.1 hypothetical protein [Salmonella enterica subsp. houtenae]EDR3236065.1 hypothetical protein [Salmonella enterica subsp. diarizonae]EDW0107070.1 hypothetical pro